MFGIGKKLAEEATQQAESAAQVAGKYQLLLFSTPAVPWAVLKRVPCSPHVAGSSVDELWDADLKSTISVPHNLPTL